MKIAITAQGTDLASLVDPRFGRAQVLIIYDLETDEFQVVSNSQNLNAAQGAGIQSARNVAEQGVECVLTGHCGPKAFHALTSAGIQVVVGVEGSVREAVDKFRSGALKPTGAADVEGHWV